MRAQPSTASALGAFAASAMLIICGEVSAQTIIALDQHRSVGTFLIVPQCFGKTSDSDAAQGFDPFRSAVETTLVCDSGFGFGSATQQSQIGASSMTASGTSSSMADGPEPDVIHAFGISYFEVTFELPSLSRFALDGTITVESLPDADDGASVLARLWEGPIGGVLIFQQSIEPPPGGGTNKQALEAAGTLEPGVYTLDVQAGSFIDNDVPPFRSGEASFDFTFEAFVVGDLDGDGVVGVLDLLALLAAWGPCPDPPDRCPPDLDSDGSVGITDLLLLLGNWG